MDNGENFPSSSSGVKSKLTGHHQTEALYCEEGQYNPKAARADKKRQKRLNAIPLPDDDDDSDFDFDAVRFTQIARKLA